MPLVHGWGIDSETFPNGFRAGSATWFFSWAYIFSHIFLNYSVLLWLPRKSKCVYTPGHLCSAHLQRKKNVQEGSNVRVWGNRLHALESDTVALLCCLIAMKITLHNNKNLYLGWLIHQPLWLKWQLWIHFGSWIVTVGNLAFRVLVYCCLSLFAALSTEQTSFLFICLDNLSSFKLYFNMLSFSWLSGLYYMPVLSCPPHALTYGAAVVPCTFPPVISEHVSTEIIIFILSLHPPCQSQASFWSSGTESALDKYWFNKITYWFFR